MDRILRFKHFFSVGKLSVILNLNSFSLKIDVLMKVKFSRPSLKITLLRKKYHIQLLLLKMSCSAALG